MQDTVSMSGLLAPVNVQGSTEFPMLYTTGILMSRGGTAGMA